MKNFQRRDFLKKTTVAAAGASLMAACQPSKEKQSVEAPNVNFNKTFQWKMVTTWPPNFPVLGEGCNLLAKWIEEMSGGRLKIHVYGGGELVPPLETFEAVSNGAVEMGHGVGYYWAGKAPAAQFFAAVPFGMNAQQLNAWIISGGGLAMWEELYAKFDLQPMVCGNTGVQMGGWFNKEINSVEDLQGLKMRIPGLGGKVLSKAGGSAVTVAGGEIYTNLERGVIDATEWIGPYHDYLMGFYRVAKYYYYPGWHEAGPVLELIVNKSKFDRLPKDLQEIIRTASMRSNVWMLSEFDAKNNLYLQKLINEEGVQLRKYPEEVLKQLRLYTKEVLDEIISEDPFSAKVYESYQKFRNSINYWSEVSEKTFYNQILN
ncbi:TRAP transporter substrate-binding protein [Fulvivirgaceae bacterium BMA10]|uniref:TRAP transporter substrate-binding protein n=1 Tax=Splendidivirga corallicola TaxID=3051826 RepID=A0ABT8KRZ0_9BACT|nr:TRAP transporter substrate-binding protein [Fulvivirgaceae bacterium BMA10]